MAVASQSPKKRFFSTTGIKRDHSRFKKIVKGKIRKNLKKYISQGEMIVKREDGKLSIPVPQIDLPRFVHGSSKGEGVSQGEGKPGDPVDASKGGGKPKPGQGKAGKDAGEHSIEVGVELEELAQMLGEELELPRIEPKGQKSLASENARYKGIRQVGPDSLRHFKRSFKEALKRQLASGLYDPKRPVIIPIKEDMKYRSAEAVVSPQNNAAILYIMDVSGSMGEEQKQIVRTEAFWIDTWLRSQYRDIERRYIIHDASAREVKEDIFYKTRESGGTLISSAYELALKMIEKNFPPSNWNLYVFHFSDGDNWSSEDTTHCMKLLKGRMLPMLNQFSYGQVESRYGSGQFYKDLVAEFPDEDRLVACRIEDREGILDSIKTFLGKGR